MRHYMSHYIKCEWHLVLKLEIENVIYHFLLNLNILHFESQFIHHTGRVECTVQCALYTAVHPYRKVH